MTHALRGEVSLERVWCDGVLYLANVLPRLTRGVHVQNIPELLPAARIAHHPESRVEPLSAKFVDLVQENRSAKRSGRTRH